MTELVAVQNGFALFQQGDRGVVIDTRTVDAVSVEPISALLAGAAWRAVDETPEGAGLWQEVATAAFDVRVDVSVTASAGSPSRVIRVPKRVQRAAQNVEGAAAALLASGSVSLSTVDEVREQLLAGEFGEAGVEWAQKIAPVDTDETPASAKYFAVLDETNEERANGLSFIVTSVYALQDDESWWLREFGEWSPTQAPEDPDTLLQLDQESLNATLSQLDEPGASYAELSITESKLFELAASQIDYETLDAAFAAVPYVDPAVRSANAKKQLRDANGQFIRQGGAVHDASGDRGLVKAVNREEGTVDVETEDGQTKTVPAEELTQEKNNDATAPAAPDATADASGVARLPEAPSLVEDVNALIAEYQAKWAEERGAAPVVAAGDDALKLPDEEEEEPTSDTDAESETPAPVAEEPAAAGDPVEGSGVTPLYLAQVDPQDTQAVLECLAVVPSTGEGDAVDAYKREGGQWVAAPDLLQAIQGPTPPPLVELQPDVLTDVLSQIDGGAEEAPVAEEAPSEPLAAGGYARLNKFVITASGITQTQVQGPRLLLSYETAGEFPSSVVASLDTLAEGGLDKNRGNAERLRRYWTKGEGAAKIRWGTDGDWTRCVAQLSEHMGERAKGYCTLRHKDALGYYPGERGKPGNPPKNELGYDDDYGPGAGYGEDSDLPHEHVPYTGDSDFIDFDECEICGRAPEHPVHIVVEVETDEYDDSDDDVELLGYSTRVVLASGAEVQGEQRFRIPLVIPEDRYSGDGRKFARGSLSSRDMPLALMWQPSGDEGHKGAVIVGRIDHVERTPDGLGNCYGVFDSGEYGQEALRLVQAGMLRGISADLDEFEAELAASDDENVVSSQKMLVKSGRLMGITLVAKPAFAECTIELVDGDEMTDGEYTAETSEARVAALLASAAPLHPPAEWFENPQLAGPTRLTVTDEGRVFGHIAAWDVDHIGLPFGTRAPRSASNYAYFATGSLRTADGTDVNVGQLTLAGGHAPLSADARAAVKHYDDTASAWADVSAGEDEFGIWVSGALRPSVTPEQIRVARASSPSGDWRPIKGKLELVAACCVNVPGFPVARTMVAGGMVTALVAAGVIMQDPPSRVETAKTLAARIEALEAAEAKRLESARAAVLSRMEPVRSQKRESMLSAFDAARSRIAPVRDARSAALFAAAEAQRARIAEFKANAPGDGKLHFVEKFDESKHPRDDEGKFRRVLARLSEILGGSDEAAPAIDKLNDAVTAEQAGDDAGAKAAAREAEDALNQAAESAGEETKGALAEAAREVHDAAKSVASGDVPAGGHGDNEESVAEVIFDELTEEAKELILEAVSKAEEQLDPANPDELLRKVKAFITGTNVMDPNDVANFVKNQLKRPFNIHGPAVAPQTPSAQPQMPVDMPGTAG